MHVAREALLGEVHKSASTIAAPEECQQHADNDDDNTHHSDQMIKIENDHVACLCGQLQAAASNADM